MIDLTYFAVGLLMLFVALIYFFVMRPLFKFLGLA